MVREVIIVLNEPCVVAINVSVLRQTFSHCHKHCFVDKQLHFLENAIRVGIWHIFNSLRITIWSE